MIFTKGGEACMPYIMNLAINITSISVLVLILFNFGQYHFNIRRNKGRNNVLFIHMIITNMALLLLDSLTWILNGGATELRAFRSSL